MMDFNLPSERKLQCELHQTRRLRLDDIAEVGIENLPLHRVGAEKLRMVEGVERLEAKLELLLLGDLEVTQHGQIEVYLARPVERTPRGSPRLAQRVLGERRDIEVGLPIARVGVDVERQTGIVRRIDIVVVDAVGAASLQRVIAVLVQRHREARGDAGDAAKLPAAGYRPPVAGQTIERKVYRVAGDKVGLEVEGRESTRAGEVERIAGIGDTRCLIDRLAPRVVEREVIALARVTKTDLQGIVV